MMGDKVNEVMINAPHNVFVEVEGKIKKFDDVNKKFSLQFLKEFSTLISTYTKQDFSELNPILSGTIHTGMRTQIVMPPACDFNQFVLSIRKPSEKTWSLEQYLEMGYFDRINKIVEAKQEKDEVIDKLKFYEKNEHWVDFFKLIVSNRKNVIIAGATGSGKTEFTKCLINCIPHDERIITIEDAREVFNGDMFRERNIVNLLTSPQAMNKRQITFSELVIACLRLRPDRILMSELRGSEAFDFLNGINTGHSGSLTSLHTNSAEEVYTRLVTMIKQSESGRGLSKDDIFEYCKNSIDVILYCDKTNGVWTMKEVIYGSS